MVCGLLLATWGVSAAQSPVFSTRHLYIGLLRGEIVMVPSSDEIESPGWSTRNLNFSDSRTWRGRLGLYSPEMIRGSSGELRMMAVPIWLLFAVAVIPTAILWHRDRRTVKPGCCLTCGYDLRASKKTCPECGTAIAPEPR